LKIERLKTGMHLSGLGGWDNYERMADEGMKVV